MERDYQSILRQGEKAQAESRRLQAEAVQLLARAKQAGEHLSWLVEEVKRQREESFYRQMQAGIRQMHRCDSQHVASFAVRKVSGSRTVWVGKVDEFELIDCRTAKSCYAWYYREWNRTQTFSVLKIPPVHSPQSAVQLALAALKLPPLVEL